MAKAINKQTEAVREKINTASSVYHALGLHMHQPPGNLQLLIDHNQWEAQQIIKCYERAARYAHLCKGIGALNIGFSGILLEQFNDPHIIEKYRPFVDIPQMIESYKSAENIEIIGMGFYHPIFPLIPQEDWEEQLNEGVAIIQEMFNQTPKGFWPSEMAFSMEMIPALKKAGYEYVIVDHVHIQPENKQSPFDCFKLYKACYDNVEITIVPRNRDISNAQESGLNPSWFLNELSHTIAASPAPNDDRLITTWSDGENGGWFRQMDDQSGFFGYFFHPLIEMINKGKAKINSIKISDYLKKHPPQEKATVRTGAWNVGSTSGYDFAQWNGSESQKKAIDELFAVSGQYWKLKEKKLSKANEQKLLSARRLILDAETSCYLFWGEAWLPKVYEKINAAKELLNKVG